MKTLCLALFAAALVSDLNARIVTLTVGGAKTNDSLVIGTNESFTILAGATPRSSAYAKITKDRLEFLFYLYYINTEVLSPARVTMAGPAVITLFDESVVVAPTFLTAEVISDFSPPDKTLVVPQGSGANIVLESSTNLVNWSPAPPGPYTNQTANTFFRIRAERSP